jgi:hypothetical protein
MKKYWILLLVFFSSLQGAARQACDTLFVLQDLGETKDLLPVIEQYAQNKENFLILSGGAAADFLAQKPILKDKIISFSQLSIPEQLDAAWKREEKISEESLKKILAEVAAPKIVTGVAFEFHGQILDAYNARGSTTFAYWDNVNPEGADSYFKIASKVAQSPQYLLVPSKAFKNAFPKAEVVGKPSLELWKQQMSGIRLASVAAKMPFMIKSPVLVFIGGYGRDYDIALREFLQDAKTLRGYTILIAPHHKFDGKVEREELKKSPLPHVRLLERSWNIDTVEAVALADHVICHQSSVGVQAAAAGKDVIYYIPSSQTYSNLIIENGGARVVSNLEGLQSCLQTKLASKKDPFETLKVPLNSAALIYDRLHQAHEQ